MKQRCCREPCKSPEDAETANVWSGRIRVTEATGDESSGMKISTQVAEDPEFNLVLTPTPR